MKSQHQYTYSFNQKVTSEMCGQNISFDANGHVTHKSIVSEILLKQREFFVILFGH